MVIGSEIDTSKIPKFGSSKYRKTLIKDVEKVKGGLVANMKRKTEIYLKVSKYSGRSPDTKEKKKF